MFKFENFLFQLSKKTVKYICPKCKNKFEVPIEDILEFEEENEWNWLLISTPTYITCFKCNYNKCVPIDYKSRREYHHIYK